jgi:DNA polymerase I-like protein with 3'-5' exonuclease and polymerase domains
MIPAKKAKDTLILSRLYNPNIEGGHSLKAWGERVGESKIDYEDLWKELGLEGNCYDNPDLPLMFDYCQQDVAVLVKVEKLIDKMLDQEKFSEQCRKLEHDVAIILNKQHEHGFKLDIPKAQGLLATLSGKMVDIENQLQTIFPPVIEEMKKPAYWAVEGLQAETKGELKAMLKEAGMKASKADEAVAGPMKTRSIPFNPGSRQQIAERLQGLGVKFSKTTDKGSIIVDEKVLEKIDLPEAKALLEYLMLQKRVAQVSSWLEEVREDGRVHGRVITNGAVTGRATHSSPNMAQIPNTSSPYGKECREVWTVDKGNVLVGVDLAGIELRCLSHYMQDAEWQKELLEGDVHWKNTQAFGLVPMGTVKNYSKEHKDARNLSKTLTYSVLYGAGSAKVGATVGGSEKEGKKLVDNFMNNTPSLKALKVKVDACAALGKIPAIDGRKIWIRSEHAALNSLLQSAGAIVAKQWIVNFTNALIKSKIPYKLVAWVHDEVQLETSATYAEKVGNIVVQAARDAGTMLQFRCPVDAEANYGVNWYETH